jgi:hypothetical protein
MQTMPLTESNRILAGSPRLAGAVNAGLLTSELPVRQHNQAVRCATYLYANGFLSQVPCAGDPGGYVSDQQMVKMRTAEAVEVLQAVKLLPAGLFGWVLAFALRWAFTLFLETLIIDWMEH